MWNRKRQNKMGNTRALCALNHSHRSKLESAVCQLIQLREKAGELKLLQVEDHVRLSAAQIVYIPDFRCLEVHTGKTMWIEAKGYPSDRWPILKKLWASYGPGLLEVWGGNHARPRLIEVIRPEGVGE